MVLTPSIQTHPYSCSPLACRQVNKSKKASARWKSCKTLVIDEVSMLDPALFAKLDYVGKEVRDGSKRREGTSQ